jgi:hypothetical protein
VIEALLNLLFNKLDIKRDDADTVYLRRWFIWPRVPDDKKLSRRVYLHKFFRGDEDPHLHTHPWRFTSVILWGGYWEHSFNPAWMKWKALRGYGQEFPEPQKYVRKWYRAGRVLRRGVKWSHKVELPEGHIAWSLIFTGVREQSWGFLTENGFCNHRNYHNGVCWCESTPSENLQGVQY